MGWAMRALIGLLVACGCASQKEAQRPAASPPPSEQTVEAGEGTVPPEKVDEIHDTLTRKGQDLEHCWREEATRTNNPKWTVDFMLALTVLESGQPSNVSIARTSSRSEPFETCVLERARHFTFPAIPVPLEVTWPYSFKPLY